MAPIQDHFEGRHPSVQHFASFFDPSRFSPNKQQVVGPYANLAVTVVSQLVDGPELSTALRKLVESLDCALRAYDRSVESAR